MMEALPPPFSLVTLESVDSTNDEARRAMAQGAGHGTVIWAREQTAGRGRRGRVWVSPPGNLHCTVLLDPGPMPPAMPQLAFVAAVAVRDAVADLAPAAKVTVKWPNDILCGRGKIAGMLLEYAAPLVVLGVGVNVALAPDPALYPAICLRQVGCGANSFDVLVSLCGHLATWYECWRREGFKPIRQAWLARASGLGEAVAVHLADGCTLEGRFADLDQGGALLLESADGERKTVMAGDVFFVDKT
jgi:BirA family biotin operon repressor/biotin-[acetyl-CoA-carboxylase] ligase